MEMLRNCMLLDGENVSRPVRITTIKTSPFELPSFEGYFLNKYCDSIYRKPVKNVELIEKVIFNDPATIVIWKDKTKTVVKCQPGDTYDAEKGLALCIAKKYFGNKGNFNEVFKKWVPEENKKPISSDDDFKDLDPIKIGTRIKIINGGKGAYGANGKIGEIVSGDFKSLYRNGLLDKDPGYYVRLDNKAVWKIALNAKIEIIR